MRARSRLPSRRLLVYLLAVIVPTVVGAVVLLVAARLSGVTYWGTSAALVAGFPISVLATTFIGWRIHQRGDRRVGWWVLATAGSALCYLVAVAIVTWAVAVQQQESILLDWLGLEALAGYIPTFLLIQATLLVTRDQLASWHRRGRVIVIVLLGIGVGSFLGGAAMLDPDAPLDPLQAPFGDTWFAGVAERLDVILYVAWILSSLVGPVALWRAVGRTRGMARRRLSIAAVVSLLRIAAIACCVLLLRALMQANLSEDAATSVIFTFFSLAIPLTVAGLAVACSGEEGLRLRSGALKGALNIAVGLLVAVAAMTLSSVLAVRLAGGSMPLIVVLTAAVVAALWPVRRWAVRRLLLRADPRVAVAAGLAQRAEPTACSRPGHAVRDVLRTALEDSSVDVAVRPRGSEAWVSVDGEDMAPPTRHPREHLTVLTDSQGEPEAYVRHATSTADAAGIVAEVRPLLDQAVLEVTVRHQAEQLATERARADSAATNERRRLERDLHDGVQGRLLSLALDLQAADADTYGEAHVVLSDAHSA